VVAWAISEREKVGYYVDSKFIWCLCDVHFLLHILKKHYIYNFFARNNGYSVEYPYTM
jgi:hypothetical protein